PPVGTTASAGPEAGTQSQAVGEPEPSAPEAAAMAIDAPAKEDVEASAAETTEAPAVEPVPASSSDTEAREQEAPPEEPAEEPKPILLWRPARFDRPAGNRRHRQGHGQSQGQNQGQNQSQAEGEGARQRH